MSECDFELSQDFVDFAGAVRSASRTWGADSKRIEGPLRILATALRSYSDSPAVLVKRAKAATENIKFSKTVADLVAKETWSVATTRKNGAVLKRILALLDLDDAFVNSLQFQTQQKPPANKALGKIAALPAEDATRQLVEHWQTMVESGTRNKSPLGVRNIMAFYRNTCVPGLGLDFRNWPQDVAGHIRAYVATNPDAVNQIVGETSDSGVKATRLRFFIKDILGSDIEVPVVKAKKPPPKDDDDGHDEHRIDSEDLQRLYDEAIKDPFDRLWFMLMLTTGLRVGGVVKILTNHVADVKSGAYIIRKQGRTKEKGANFVHFPICPVMQLIFKEWLESHRRADPGPFLLPGLIEGRCLTTECIRKRFKTLCQRINLQGTEFHPHALRHTHAHILLGCGNKLEVVSKALNHKSVTVTEKVYLRESATEVSERVNAPWMRMETEEQKRKRAVDALPSFLRQDLPLASSSSGKTQEEKARKKQRRTENKALCDAFKP